METRLPLMPQLHEVVGHSHHRPVAHLAKKTDEIIDCLNGIASFETHIGWITDEEQHVEFLRDWERRLGSALALQDALASEGAKRLRRDVRRFVPQKAAALAEAIERALYVAEELERFIRQVIFSSAVEHDIIPDFDPEPAGASVAFEW